jgi:hypothetical protein
MNKGCVKKYRTAFLILESISSFALWALMEVFRQQAA